MAVFTELSLEDAARVARAHRLAAPERVEAIAAGSVNSNYFVHGPDYRVFVRLYEEQDVAGVAYEWALLDALAGVAPLARRLEGPAPGELRVAARSVAVFDAVEGQSLAQREVRPRHLEALGAALARCHRAVEGFGWRRKSRFDAKGVRARFPAIEAAIQGEGHETLRAMWPELRARIEAAVDTPAAALRNVPVHGDLFRDNVLWASGATEPSALLDWESAADGPCVQDLAVVLLAWCVGDDLDFELARALVGGYQRERALDDLEWQALYDELRRAAARFCATRITDFYLRRAAGVYGAVYKDYRRFVLRLDKIEQLGHDGVRARLRA